MTLPFRPVAEGSRAGVSARARGVTAVLGPTNTGKTHLAIERMLGHDSGMIGLPLRLLAREVYQRIVARVGAEAVALVTGEEKIKPKAPRYWVSTVEAMPRDLDVSFVAIDEIQLIADFERGHVFTDALLHRRGRAETLLLGAATAQPLIERLLPGVRIETRPRLSRLVHAGEKKITRLPPRAAVIAFSAEEVYAIAELVRRQRGGAAVVMGSLSPRTRNAQVAMFQAGEVDHIVATDAIGMGLNLEIGHVAFAADRKFDGRRHRRLFPAEMAQIAGRAGRAVQDGTFGTTGRCPAFDEDLVEALEEHRFDPLAMAQWRNSALDFATLDRLEASLNRAPGDAALVRARRADDEATLEIAMLRPAIRDLARGEAAVRRLWDLCQLPDYRKVSPGVHADLVVSLYEAIIRKGAIDADWFSREIKACDRIEGDIDTLSWRLAQIRTWSYCANRPDWLADPLHWQNVTRALEDKVSDALHERLMQRFVDRRTSVLMRRLKENVMLEAEVNATGDVLVEGQHIGRLEGFRFTPDPGAEAAEAKTLRAAAGKALAGEIETRAARLSTANDDQLQLSLDGVIRYLGEPIATLQAGARPLEPRFLLLADEALAGLHREMVETRIANWIKAHVQKLLGALFALEAAEGVTGIARGIAFRVAEALGVLDRAAVANDVRALDQNARAELRKLGLRFGAHHLFLPALMKPGPRSLAAQLFALQRGDDPAALRDVSHLAFSGRTSIPVDPAINRELYRVAGFRVVGPRAVRVDILERLADLIRPAVAYRPGVTPGAPPPGAADGDGFVVTGAMTSLVGCAGAEFGEILKSLGYRAETRPGPAITVPLKIEAPVAATEPLRAESPETAMPEPGIPDATMSAIGAAGPAPAEASATDWPADSTGRAEREGAAIEAAAPVEDAAAPVEAGPEAGEEAASEISDVSAAAGAADPAAASTAAEPAADVAAAPVEIEIWRIARPDRNRPPQRGRGNPRHRESGRDEGRASPGQPERQAGDDSPRPERREGERRHERPKRFFPGQGHGGAGPQPEENAGRNGQGHKAPAHARGHGQGKGSGHGQGYGQDQGKGLGKGDGPRRDRSGNRGGDRDAPRVFGDRPRDTNRAPDPDSPFAKLAALKAQLEGKT
ncbi:helicase-related protein [Rhabdaerophilum calidifontis]|uniref:helicase-related protein n=1 Tax=Rhabdaerophilum calidifontis TaxID=2604328 RepID=UPI00123A479A|nr:helicase-related protein [Rhabdaerophilum calidifontis]